RKEDIPLLARQLVERFNRLQSRSVQGVSAEALSLMFAYDWPGNVRELENVIERAFILCGQGFIEIRHLPEELTGRVTSPPVSGPSRVAHDMLDSQAIRAALERNDDNRNAAARELGIHKTTLFRRMKKLGIPRPARDGRSARRP
ncbi:MAG: Fis family transcriptional regulator, partial [Acidobacteria bacterium]